MTVIKITGFSGEVPRLVPRLLPDTAAQNATNARLDSGGLSPYRKPKFTYRITDIAAGAVKTIYRNGNTWMAWDKTVYPAPGPVAADRLYIFGDGAPKMLVDGVTYKLAVEFPPNPLTASLIADTESLTVSGTNIPLTDGSSTVVGSVTYTVALDGRKATITAAGTITPTDAAAILTSISYKNTSNPSSRTYKRITVDGITNDKTDRTSYFDVVSIVRTGGFQDSGVINGDVITNEGDTANGRPGLSITPLNPTWVDGSAAAAAVFSGVTIDPGTGATDITKLVFSIDGLVNDQVDQVAAQNTMWAYTFVTDFGEESEPCPVSNDLLWSDGISVRLTGFKMPLDTTRRITKQRIYRSQTSAAATTLFLAAERDASTDDFIDNVPSTQLDEPIPSLNYNAPDDGLTGVISLPNGMMVGFNGKVLSFCEPWLPHAWPEVYNLTMDSNIVALGAYGTTIVVATEAQPYVVSGTSPDTMSQEKLELNLPCINARGLVDLGYAIAYPSNDGLAVVSSGSARVVTDQLMTRDNWIKTAPDRFVSGQFYGLYFASYEYVDPTGNALQGSFIIDLTGQVPSLKRTGYKADATWYDVEEGKLYLCMGQDIYEWDALDSENEILTWRSKQYVIPKPTNFGVILIEGSILMTPEEEAAEQAADEAAAEHNASIFGNASIGGEINGAAFNTYPVNGDDLERLTASRFVSVTVYADGEPVATVSKLNHMARLPGGFLAQTWEVEVSANADIAQVTLAGTGAELAGV